MKMLNKLKRKLIDWWKNSRIFASIDKAISHHYRKRLKNDQFTILCSNCIGGVMYHRLGKEFLSPTINLYMNNPDFAEFCLHLDYFLEQKLCFVATELPHPVALLKGNGANIPDITIFFNHDSVNEEAEEKWERRKTRINKDNMYIVMYYLDGITIDTLKKLGTIKCRNKVVFTAEPLPEIPWSYYIEPNLKSQYPYAYLGKDAFGRRYFEKKFDFVGFLNS